jgi:hypothetical protein
VSDEAGLGPEDPTPDPEVKQDPAQGKGTTFLDVTKAAEAAAEKIDTSDGIQAEEVVDAALEGAGKVVPLTHHAISELRRLLVPIVTAVIAAGAGGGFGAWKAEGAKVEAVRQAEQRIEESQTRERDLRHLETEIRKLIIREASWDEVGALEINEARVMADVAGITTELPSALAGVDIPDLIQQQIKQVQTEVALPPRPAPR